jgi:penicillin-binding protein 1C
VTVGVWAGNFDGRPLREASGVTVAAPAFHALMLAAMRGKPQAPLVDAAGLSQREVCSVSGHLPGPACQHRHAERFIVGREPAETCKLHVLASLDPQGHWTDPSCGGQARPIEVWPAEYRAWAQQAGRGASADISTTCPPRALAAVPGDPRVTFPIEGQRFAVDPDGPGRQELVLSASAPGQIARFVVDGRVVAEVAAPFRVPWPMEPGAHELVVESAGRRSPSVRFNVQH